MGGAYPWLPLRSLSCHLDNRSRDCLGSSSLPLTLVLLNLVQFHLFLMIQLSVVILETHTVWIRLISTKGGKMETSRIRQRQRLSRYFYGRGLGLASTSTTLRQTILDIFLISSSSWHFLDLLLLLNLCVHFTSSCSSPPKLCPGKHTWNALIGYQPEF